MLLATQLQRKFTFKSKNQDVSLPDPDPGMSPEAVLNFYSNQYPELTTAKIEGPEIKDDTVQFKFTSVMGTKGRNRKTRPGYR